MSNTEEISIHEIASYKAGRSAHAFGVPDSDNPHPSQFSRPGGGFSRLRYQWFMGWYDQKHGLAMSDPRKDIKHEGK